MRVTDWHKLIEQTRPAPDHNEESLVARKVHEVLALTFLCFDAWIKPLFSQVKGQKPSPVQEYDPYADPYVAGLLRYLNSRRRD